MRKLQKSELQRVYGGGHNGADKGRGSKSSDTAGDPHTNSGGSVTVGTDID